jgi:hypothetical protein
MRKHRTRRLQPCLLDDRLLLFPFHFRIGNRQHVRRAELVVPDVERVHAAELGYSLPERLAKPAHHRALVTRRKSAFACGNHERCGEPAHIPVERTRQRFVEVVRAEQHAPLRAREQPEIGQMRVAAQLHGHVGTRQLRQVVRHQRRGTAIERERVRDHAAVANGYQLRDPSFVGRIQQRHGIAIADLADRQFRTRHPFARGLALLDACGQRGAPRKQRGRVF